MGVLVALKDRPCNSRMCLPRSHSCKRSWIAHAREPFAGPAQPAARRRRDRIRNALEPHRSRQLRAGATVPVVLAALVTMSPKLAT